VQAGAELQDDGVPWYQGRGVATDRKDRAMEDEPHSAGWTVRPATRADLPQATDAMSRAFVDKDPFTWLEPDPLVRARLLPAMFRSTLRFIYPLDRGAEVATEGGALLGCAVWVPPGQWQAPLLAQLRFVPAMLVALGLRGLRSYAARGQAVERALHSVHPAEPHWYLAALGVDPSAHGKGVGSALMRSGVERCDREGAPAYLECLEVLVPYYQRFGFTDAGRIDMPEGALPQVSMWRPPR
jgi:GNAT superfamily N-acetyltransferase